MEYEPERATFELEPEKLTFGDKLGNALHTLFWMLVLIVATLIAAGFSMIEFLRQIGVTGAAWKFLLG